ncbi:hypothetical protein BJ085DRAFT_36306 [Dimargaris cristalligena]|uniref:Cyclin N-terminal domain-containing protein n=1 Tax=Dimargaris cristalligena TaxID=215637 RepID=A0A4P9ZZ82_9FUNG|nr:hypothetical protein BJ085DRAFT_36306 [Dimargaris cristalligena]|eukprot:RKP38282.1 hypothetical protein BJ085DRAFT_36306 [Dimargaris cristalligena]
MASASVPNKAVPDDFLLRAATRLTLPSQAFFQAYVYYHRYQRTLATTSQPQPNPGGLPNQETRPQSILLDNHMVILGCILLSGKACEEVRQIKDIINVGHHIINPDTPFLNVGTVFHQLQSTLETIELCLLRILRFDMTTDLPYPWIRYICEGQVEAYPEVQQRVTMNHLMQLTWAFANDCARESSIVLNHTGRAIAAACTATAMLTLRVPTPVLLDKWSKEWGRCSPDALQGIVQKLEQLYSQQLSLDTVEPFNFD